MKWLQGLLFALAIWTGGCQQPTTLSDVAIPLDTSLFLAPQPIGRISDPTLAEISGLAPSNSNPGLLWTEEDSDNPNQIQLIKPTGAVAGRFGLPTLTNYDWEDMATGPGPVTGQSYVYLAEIGDNAAGPINRVLHDILGWTASKVIYRFAEPVLTNRNHPQTATITAIDAITLTLPYGPEDVEAILLDPVSHTVLLLSKGRVCKVYWASLPASLTAPVALHHAFTLPFRRVTSAAISPDGREILIRTYKQLFYYRRQAGESVLTALKRQPCQLPLAPEPQGEAIGWRRDGSGFYSISEVYNHVPQFIYFYQRREKPVGQAATAGKPTDPKTLR